MKSKIFARVINSASLPNGTLVRILSVNDDAALCATAKGDLVALTGRQLEPARFYREF